MRNFFAVDFRAFNSSSFFTEFASHSTSSHSPELVFVERARRSRKLLDDVNDVATMIFLKTSSTNRSSRRLKNKPPGSRRRKQGRHGHLITSLNKLRAVVLKPDRQTQGRERESERVRERVSIIHFLFSEIQSPKNTVFGFYVLP